VDGKGVAGVTIGGRPLSLTPLRGARGPECAVVVLAVALVGCAHARRVGPASPLPAAEPQNECERERWLELVAAEYRPATGFPPRPKAYSGLGIFRPNAADPEDLEEVFSRMDDAALQAQHQERVKRTDAANRRSLASVLIGGGGMALGVGAAAALNDSHHDAANVFGVSGLAIGLVGVIVALIVAPSEDERMDGEARHKLFLEGEADTDAVERGVNRANLATRQACQAR
jgi:hypothetical protein